MTQFPLRAQFPVKHVVGGVVSKGNRLNRRLCAEGINCRASSMDRFAFILEDFDSLFGNNHGSNGILRLFLQSINLSSWKDEIVVRSACLATHTKMPRPGCLRRSGKRSEEHT